MSTCIGASSVNTPRYSGRDVLSRVLASAGPSVLSALAMVGVGHALGAGPGVPSAFSGRRTEFALQRFTDSLMSLPPIVFAIAVAGLFTNGLTAAIVAIGVPLAPRFFRIARAERSASRGPSTSRRRDCSERRGGGSSGATCGGKLLPTVATSAGFAVLAAASLGFLGLGVEAPEPTWGGMLAANVEYLAEDTLAPLWPGAVHRADGVVAERAGRRAA